MYDFPELAKAHDDLWTGIVSYARAAGLSSDVPLLQICGYPLARSLRTVYDVIAAPRYALPLCPAATHHALIVVAARSSFWRLGDLRGARFAMNAPDSNTGSNLPRRLIAPLAHRGRFFGEVIETGSHAASLAAVVSGAADAASIDSVTFGLLAEHRPQAIAGIRMLAATEASPTPPFVTPRGIAPARKALLYDVLAQAIDDSEFAGGRRALHLAGIAPASLETYDVLVRHEEEAADLRYPVLA